MRAVTRFATATVTVRELPRLVPCCTNHPKIGWRAAPMSGSQTAPLSQIIGLKESPLLSGFDWRDLILGWEIFGPCDTYLVGASPLRSAEKCVIETTALHRVISMPESGVENTALAISQRHQHRLITLCLLTRCSCQYFHVLRWSTHHVVKLVFRVEPLCTHSLCDGVLIRTIRNDELMLRSMVPTFAL